MKKINFICALSLLPFAMMAQTSYTNAEISSTSDLIGTARYVGMGGALGALGGDISAISTNPAAIGLFSNYSQVSLTAGGMWQTYKGPEDGKSSRGTFDQMGFVATWKTEGMSLRNINVGFNYQKKNNFGSTFNADNDHLNNISQADQFAELANRFYDIDNSPYTLYGAAYDSYLYEQDAQGFYNPYNAKKNRFSNYQSGSTQSFDINISGNFDYRYFWGLTIGVENVDYERHTSYTEERDDAGRNIQDYTIDANHQINGTGVNVKLGTIIRPFEESSFRVGFAIETPTWYRLKSSSYWDIWSKWYYDEANKADVYLTNGYYKHPSIDDNYLEYNLRSPWRVRLSMGHTLDKYFAWGLEYEYANYGKNHMSYSDNEYDPWDDVWSHKVADKEMNLHTKRMFKKQHTAKMGFEIKPTDQLAFRMGYNFISSVHKCQARMEQDIDSYAMDYVSNTNYMNLSDVNILTCGMGYQYNKFRIDLVYKFRQQSGKFYAFDDSFTTNPNSQFVQDNPNLAGVRLDPVDVNLNRHMLTCTMALSF